MRISITDVPQADELLKVIATVEAVHNDSKTDRQIGDYVGFTDRQGRYYRLAAIILNLLSNDNNNASLTELGRELIVLDDANRLKKIRTILRGNDLFKIIIEFIEDQVKGVNRSELLSFLLEIIDGAESTISRRLNTIISWLVTSELLQIEIEETSDGDRETRYKINDQLDESDFLDKSTFRESIYPSNYTNEELDIKEVHMQVISLLRKREQGKIIVPEFQRNQVWKQQQKSRFIESLILNIPVPPFYISQDFEGNMIIVDGLQRSSSVFEFLNDEYSLVGLEALPELNGKLCSGLDKDLKARLEDRELLLYVLKSTVPMSIVYDIFNRINSNGSPLTSQEIRNCIYIGQSTKLLARLSANESFREAIDYGIPPLRMKDREAILRFFAFILFDYETEYKGNLDDFLGKAMRKLNVLPEIEIQILESQFIEVMEKTFEFFHYHNFRLPTDNTRGRINVALMEVVSVFFYKQTEEFLETNKEAITDNYYNVLLEDPEFLDSIRTSTSSERNVTTRFTKAFEILSNIS